MGETGSSGSVIKQITKRATFSAVVAIFDFSPENGLFWCACCFFFPPFPCDCYNYALPPFSACSPLLPPRNQAVMMHCPRSSSPGHSAQAEGEPSGGSQRLQACDGALHRCPAEAGPPRCFSIPPPLLLGPGGSSRGQPDPSLRPSLPPLQPRPGGGTLPAPAQCLGGARLLPAEGPLGPAQRRRRALPCPSLPSAAGRACSTCLRCPP